MNILVIGDHCLDEFIYCKCERLSPEAPVPVAEPFWAETNEGMAGNVCANLRSLSSDNYVTLLKNKGNIVKIRYIDKESNQTLLRVDRNDKVREPYNIDDLSGNFDAIVIADYGKGFISEEFLIELPKLYPDTDLYLDTKKVIKEWGKDYIIKINEPEYEEAVNPSIKYEALIITRGSKGSSFYNGLRIEDSFYMKANKVEVNEVSGAGDTFMAALVVAHTIEKKNWSEAVRFANKAAAEAVKHVGVVAVKREWVK